MQQENEEKSISEYKVKFFGFISDKMDSEDMSIRADLSINGKRYFPGLKVNKSGETEKLDLKISGTGKIISIESLNAREKTVSVFITAGKGAVIPPDSVILEISYKRFVWIVCLGAVLIAAGLRCQLQHVTHLSLKSTSSGQVFLRIWLF